MNVQLPLSLRWPAHQRFDTFILGGNAGALELIRHSAEHTNSVGLFLAGPAGCGKTHLLIAACAAATATGYRAQYLSLATWTVSRPAMIRASSGNELLAIDAVDAIAGDAESEHALFDLYNQSRAEQVTLLFAGSSAPVQMGLTLPDLVSRLSACTQVIVRPLDEAGRREVLWRRAAARGFELDDSVLDWLFTRQARDLSTLTKLLDQIDTASLAAQRRVTVPFLRRVLNEKE